VIFNTFKDDMDVRCSDLNPTLIRSLIGKPLSNFQEIKRSNLGIYLFIYLFIKYLISLEISFSLSLSLLLSKGVKHPIGFDLFNSFKEVKI